MELSLYIRPREKIRLYGQGSLSTSELLQVILGSGGKYASGAQLAREVAVLLQQGEVNLQKLVGIKGMGFAKACQVLAAVELSRRLKL